jgi:hypothetical protein
MPCRCRSRRDRGADAPRAETRQGSDPGDLRDARGGQGASGARGNGVEPGKDAPDRSEPHTQALLLAIACRQPAGLPRFERAVLHVEEKIHQLVGRSGVERLQGEAGHGRCGHELGRAAGEQRVARRERPAGPLESGAEGREKVLEKLEAQRAAAGREVRRERRKLCFPVGAGGSAGRGDREARPGARGDPVDQRDERADRCGLAARAGIDEDRPGDALEQGSSRGRAHSDGGSSDRSRSPRVMSNTARSTSTSSGACSMPRRANMRFWISNACSRGHSVIWPNDRA